MESLLSGVALVKPRTEANLETDGEAFVRVRKAIGYVRRAKYVALSVWLNGNHTSLVDVPKIAALRALRRLRERLGNAAMVHLEDVFGTLVVGM